MELQDVEEIMQNSKNGICSLPSFSVATTTNYSNVGDYTQNSVFVQKKIEEFTTEFDESSTQIESIISAKRIYVLHLLGRQPSEQPPNDF